MVNVSKVASTELAMAKTLLNDGFLRKTENVEGSPFAIDQVKVREPPEVTA